MHPLSPLGEAPPDRMPPHAHRFAWEHPSPLPAFPFGQPLCWVPPAANTTPQRLQRPAAPVFTVVYSGAGPAIGTPAAGRGPVVAAPAAPQTTPSRRVLLHAGDAPVSSGRPQPP
eukprot:EG_transcript_55221